MLPWIRPGILPRLQTYLAEMFPVWRHLLLAAVLYLSSVSVLGRIHNLPPTLLSTSTLVGICSVFFLLLILRLMDELKDKEIDEELFPQRPLPSGQVLEGDIRFALGAVIAAYLALNLLVIGALWSALGVLGYSLLMFRFFGIPRILRKYLLLNLATHNPIVPIILLYLVVLFAEARGLPLTQLHWTPILLFLGMYWALFLAWEMARKIRSPEEENEYVTYSQIFGRRRAVAIVGGIQTAALTAGLSFYHTYALSNVFLAVLLAGYGVVVWGHARFWLRPNPITSRLRPFAESYTVFFLLAHLLEHGLVI